MQSHTFSHWPSRVLTLLYSCRESLSGAQAAVLPRTASTWTPPWTKSKTTLWGCPSHHPTCLACQTSSAPSVSDILRAHKTTSSWKLFMGNHFATLCHDKGCTPCATYMLHLTGGQTPGNWVPNPKASGTRSRKPGQGPSDASARMRPRNLNKPIEPSIG